MDARRFGAIALIVIGTLGLVFGSFGYGRETRQMSIGSTDISVSEKRVANVPVWAGAGAIALGVLLIFAGPKSKS